MHNNKKISAILLLSGSGNRFDSDLPKQFHNLSGKNVYLHTLDVFYKTKVFDEIILVCLKGFTEQVKKQTSNYKNIKVIAGGQTRQESSYLGLLSCESPNYVVIHDAVRPFISEKIIFDNIEAVIKYKAVDTCIKSFDTLVQIDENRAIENIPNRNFILRGQTPQSFEYSLILNAHKDAIKQNISNATDDCQLLLNKTKIYVVDGCENNIKITTKLDLFLAEQLFRLKKVSINSDNLKIKSLENKIFAVVGASGGIGSEISDLLEIEKATVIKISKKSSEYKADISNFSDVKKIFEKVFQKYGKIDGLINAAGLLIVKPFKKLQKSEIDEQISVNLNGLIYCCHQARIKDFGHIINISSSSYSMGRKNFGVYSSSKAAVVNFSQSLAEEFENLYVNTIVPQRTKTKMRKVFFPNEDEALLLDPKIIAEKTISLLKNNFITGSIIEIRNH